MQNCCSDHSGPELGARGGAFELLAPGRGRGYRGGQTPGPERREAFAAPVLALAHTATGRGVASIHKPARVSQQKEAGAKQRAKHQSAFNRKAGKPGPDRCLQLTDIARIAGPCLTTEKALPITTKLNGRVLVPLDISKEVKECERLDTKGGAVHILMPAAGTATAKATTLARKSRKAIHGWALACRQGSQHSSWRLTGERSASATMLF